VCVCVCVCDWTVESHRSQDKAEWETALYL